MSGTFYQILGIKKTATATEVKCAYRRLAKMAHPDVDKTPGAADRFMVLQEAYEVLSDPARRAGYDASLRANRAPSSSGANHPAGASPSSSPPPSGPGAGSRQNTSGSRPSKPQPPAQPAPNWPLVLAAIGRVMWARLRPYAVGALVGGFISVSIFAALGINALLGGPVREEPSGPYPAVRISLGTAREAPPPFVAVTTQPEPDAQPDSKSEVHPGSGEAPSSDPPTAEETTPVEETSVPELAGRWRGIFVQAAMMIPFNIKLEQEGARVAGNGSEPNRGRTLRFTFEGNVTGSTLTFVKRYDENLGLPVRYTATAVDRTRIRGLWEMGIWSGTWRAERWEESEEPIDFDRDESLRSQGPNFSDRDETWRIRKSGAGRPNAGTK